MLPTTSSPQVKLITGSSYLGPPDRVTGCYTQLGDHERAQELLDACPALIEKRKLGAAKHLPTEVFILKKCKSRKRCGYGPQPCNNSSVVKFYKTKQRRKTGSEDCYAEGIKISTAEGEL